MQMESKRLNKAISETGFCSRREADRLISEGKVRVNGKVAGLGVQVTATDLIEINGRQIKKEVANIYLAFHKPVGITCTTDTSKKDNIIDFIQYPERIFPIGRLDKPSEGLIFLTNDGDIVNKILRAGNNHEKEYIVNVNRKITQAFIRQMSNGVPILNTLTKKCRVEKLNDFTFKIILRQGLNRQIRRMCSHLGYEVTRLKRVRIMNIELGNLKRGEYRQFSPNELEEINKLLANSSKTQEASQD